MAGGLLFRRRRSAIVDFDKIKEASEKISDYCRKKPMTNHGCGGMKYGEEVISRIEANSV